jgi:hypothetical protein
VDHDDEREVLRVVRVVGRRVSGKVDADVEQRPVYVARQVAVAPSPA